jgi:hypothetical protein
MSGTRLRSPVVLVTLVACACSASPAQVDDAQAPARQPSVTTDVVYGHKDGLALTLDVHRPAHPNGAGLISIVSGGWQSSVELARIFTQAYPPLNEKGFTIFAVRHGSFIHDHVSRAGRNIALNEAASVHDRAIESGEERGRDRRGPKIGYRNRFRSCRRVEFPPTYFAIHAWQLFGKRDRGDTGFLRESPFELGVRAIRSHCEFGVRFVGRHVLIETYAHGEVLMSGKCWNYSSPSSWPAAQRSTPTNRLSRLFSVTRSTRRGTGRN